MNIFLILVTMEDKGMLGLKMAEPGQLQPSLKAKKLALTKLKIEEHHAAAPRPKFHPAFRVVSVGLLKDKTIVSAFKTFYQDPEAANYRYIVPKTANLKILDIIAEYRNLQGFRQGSGLDVPDVQLGLVDGIPALRMKFIQGATVDLKEVGGQFRRNQVLGLLEGNQKMASEASIFMSGRRPISREQLSKEDQGKLLNLLAGLRKILSVSHTIDDLQFVIESHTGRPYLIDPLSNKSGASAGSQRMKRENIGKLQSLMTAVSKLLSVKVRSFPPHLAQGKLSRSPSFDSVSELAPSPASSSYRSPSLSRFSDFSPSSASSIHRSTSLTSISEFSRVRPLSASTSFDSLSESSNFSSRSFHKLSSRTISPVKEASDDGLGSLDAALQLKQLSIKLPEG